MQDLQLYEQILRITSPRFVERVELKLEQGEVHVYLSHPVGVHCPCPECGTLCNTYDHQPAHADFKGKVWEAC